jgi:hypothetical protein
MTGKEPPGRWTGRLAADLGLDGVVGSGRAAGNVAGHRPGGELSEVLRA